ncbi:hypothetical protein B0H14DRAFT_3172314, partial [Mycena olivaceomarginata]
FSCAHCELNSWPFSLKIAPLLHPFFLAQFRVDLAQSRRVQTELLSASTLHRTSVLIPKKNTVLFGSEPSIFVHSRNDSLTA